MSTTSSDVDATTSSHIKQYGWSCLHVSPGKDEPEFTPFSYSIGFTESYQAPEVIVFALSREKAHGLLNQCAELLAEGGRLRADVEDDRILAHGYKVLFRPLPLTAYSQYLGTALRYYGQRNFDALVMFLPDREHRLPWDQGYCGADAAEAVAVTGPPENRPN